MRIRKRTPARAASPGPTRHRPNPHRRRSSSSSATGVQKPDSEPATQGASTAALPARCSRNDGKRWRCKNEAVPGYMLCDRHMAWSTRRRRRPRASNKNRSGGVLEEVERTKEGDSGEDEARNKYEAAMEASNLPCDGGGDEFSYYGGGGFQPGSPKRARNGGAGPAA
ncbi:hypothetical protein ACQ4PT_001806 [Festuca glaucescens]